MGRERYSASPGRQGWREPVFPQPVEGLTTHTAAFPLYCSGTECAGGLSFYKGREKQQEVVFCGKGLLFYHSGLFLF